MAAQMLFTPNVPTPAEAPIERDLTIGQFDLHDFQARAEVWKPEGYNALAERRVRFLENDTEADVKKGLEKYFPETFEDLLPVSKNIVPLVIGERAKVFKKSCWRIARRAPNGKIDEIRDDDPLQIQFQEAWRESQLPIRLDEVNRYTEGLNTTFLRLGWDDADQRIEPAIFTGPDVDVLPLPSRPVDLDAALGILLKVSGEDGLRKPEEGSEPNYEFWSRDSNFSVVDGDAMPVPGNEGGENPYTAARKPGQEERKVVPIIAFLNHPPSRGLWSLANEDLVRESLALSAASTDLQEIIRQQGYGEIFVNADDAGQKAMGSGERVRSPGHLQLIPKNAQATLLTPQPSIQAANEVVKDRLKHTALLQKLPVGAVLADARTVAAAEALEIERISLEEYREESILRYVEPVERLWFVFRAVWNARAVPAQAGQPFGPEIVLMWEPGDLRFRSSNLPLACPDYLQLNEFRRRTGEGVLLKKDGTPDPAGDMLPSVARLPQLRPVAPPGSATADTPTPKATLEGTPISQVNLAPGKTPPAAPAPPAK